VVTSPTGAAIRPTHGVGSGVAGNPSHTLTQTAGCRARGGGPPPPGKPPKKNIVAAIGRALLPTIARTCVYYAAAAVSLEVCGALTKRRSPRSCRWPDRPPSAPWARVDTTIADYVGYCGRRTVGQRPEKYPPDQDSWFTQLQAIGRAPAGCHGAPHTALENRLLQLSTRLKDSPPQPAEKGHAWMGWIFALSAHGA